MNAHYFEVEDIDYWIDRNKEILTRWQEEKAFVMQLKADMKLQEIFGIVINKTEHTSDANIGFSSGIMTIDRAFSNRFDMACELVREAERATELSKNDKLSDGLSKNDELLDGVRTELEDVLEMTRLFKDEEGAFNFFYERTKYIA
jgi:hypothetical protein